MTDIIVGIDLGTTNSEVAVVRDGTARVLEFEGEGIMPSVVGWSPEGRLLIGTPALNQFAAWPERTIRSVKRHMGSMERISCGDTSLLPQEVSALILKELARRAELALGAPVRKAVITVPAWFTDAQRRATKDAGDIAGLEVVRIVNEPTAASLAYGFSTPKGERLALVYDLGGGTFDVSLVLSDGELTEVLASHGDTKLGGDDLDRLLADDLAVRHIAKGHPDPRTNLQLAARLLVAAERAKRALTEEVLVRVREEFFGHDRDGAPIHLDLELHRDRFEELFSPLIEKTLVSVDEALRAAGRTIAEVEDIILVGGSTKSPIIARRLLEATGKTPHLAVHPDLCVALGASVLAARSAGEEHGKVLVDVTPHGFGPSFVARVDGEFIADCYDALIPRNTPLPVTRSETFVTLRDEQEAWEVEIYQGEHPYAPKNFRVGRFMVDGLSKVPAGNEVICKMHLDLDGLLTVEVIERCTGHKKRVTIEAGRRMEGKDLDAARLRTDALWGSHAPAELEKENPTDSETPWQEESKALIDRAKASRARMADEDQEELDDLLEVLGKAIADDDEPTASSVGDEVSDLLYYSQEI